jgi:hypothetical protein
MSEPDDQIEYDRAHDSMQQQGDEGFVNEFLLTIRAELEVIPAEETR